MAGPNKPYDGGTQVAALGRQYETVGVSQAAQPLGGAGLVGDTLDYVWIFPQDTSPGVVIVADGAVTVWTWPAGTTLSDTRPIFVPLNLRSVNGPWQITTPADATVLASGIFSA